MGIYLSSTYSASISPGHIKAVNKVIKITHSNVYVGGIYPRPTRPLNIINLKSAMNLTRN